MTDPQHDAHDDGAPCGCSQAQLERIHEYLDGALTVDEMKADLSLEQLHQLVGLVDRNELTNVRMIRGDGVVVTQIERGAPALRAGLRPGDIIVAVNGLPIETVDDVIRLADSGGRSWRFTLNRQGRTINQFLRF